MNQGNHRTKAVVESKQSSNHDNGRTDAPKSLGVWLLPNKAPLAPAPSCTLPTRTTRDSGPNGSPHPLPTNPSFPLLPLTPMHSASPASRPSPTQRLVPSGIHDSIPAPEARRAPAERPQLPTDRRRCESLSCRACEAGVLGVACSVWCARCGVHSAMPRRNAMSGESQSGKQHAWERWPYQGLMRH